MLVQSNNWQIRHAQGVSSPTLFDRIGYTYGAQYIGNEVNISFSHSPNAYVLKVTVDHMTGHIWKAATNSSSTNAIVYLDHYDPDGTFIESIATSVTRTGGAPHFLANNGNIWYDETGNDGIGGYITMYHRASNGVSNHYKLYTGTASSSLNFYTVFCCGTGIVAFTSISYSSGKAQKFYVMAWNGTAIQQYIVQESNVYNSHPGYFITTSDADFFDGYYYNTISQYTTNFMHVRFNLTTKTFSTNTLSTNSVAINGSGYVENGEVFCTNGNKLGKVNADGTVTIISDGFVSVGKKTADGITVAQMIKLLDQKWFIIKTTKSSEFAITDFAHKSTSTINALSFTAPEGAIGNMVAYYNPQTNTVTLPDYNSTSIKRFTLNLQSLNFSVPPYDTDYINTKYIRI